MLGRGKIFFSNSVLVSDTFPFQALDVLLELSASSKEQAGGYYESTSSADAKYLLESNDSVCYIQLSLFANV